MGKTSSDLRKKKDITNVGVIKLKPCPQCGLPYMLVHLTGYTEPHMRDVLYMSVKCENCGYECKLGTLRDSEVDSVPKAYKIAAEAWNRRTN